MRIEKAIEILSHRPSAQNPTAVAGYFEAVKLGIEALKRLKEHREHYIDITYRALPGETGPSRAFGDAGDS